MKISATTLAMVAATTTALLLSLFAVQAQQVENFICVRGNRECFFSGIESVCNGNSASSSPSDCNLGKDCGSCNVDVSNVNITQGILSDLDTWCAGRGGQVQDGPLAGLGSC